MMRERDHGRYIDVAVTIFSGFLQKRATQTSGFVSLASRCERLLCGTCNARVRFNPWRVDVSDVAEALWNERRPGVKQLHLVAGYSYGGQTALDYCRQLQLRGSCEVAELWLCDPVRRWKALPGVAAGLGLGVLTIPRVVTRVVPFRQRNPRWKLGRPGGVFQPRGHELAAESLHTTIEPWIETPAGHCYIDNDTDFRDGFLSLVRRYARGLESR